MTIEASVIAVDTNILIYAEGGGDIDRQQRSWRLLTLLNRIGYVLPVQVAGEFLRVMRRKFRIASNEAVRRLDELSIRAVLAPTTELVFAEARQAMDSHGLDIWDSIILAASRTQGSKLLLSEDMQDGFVWRGLTVANPFAANVHPLLMSHLGDAFTTGSNP